MNERAYQFSKSATMQNAFPVTDPTRCVYFWTALARLSPSHQAPNSPNTNFIMPASSYRYDVYILVFRKGWIDQSFPAFNSEVFKTRLDAAGNLHGYIPSTLYTTYNAGAYNPSTTPVIQNAMPPIGEYGIGAISGTVFRQGIDPSLSGALPRPMIAISGTPEPIIYCPPSAGTTSSPLINVYQTTLSF
jgi:hypothetical protein